MTIDLNDLAAGLTQPQLSVFNDPKRFRLLMHGRRWGGSYLLMREAIRAGLSTSRQNVAIVAPTRTIAKLTFWSDLASSVPKYELSYKNETNLTLGFLNGSYIRLYGANHAGDAMCGCGFDLVAVENPDDTPLKVWSDVIRPALADRRGKAILAGSPRYFGGWVHETVKRIQNGDLPDWSYHHFTTAEGGY